MESASDRAASARSRHRIGSAVPRCTTTPRKHRAASDRRNLGMESNRGGQNRYIDRIETCPA
eukprot:4211998-Pyramimonas_sp.AAC.1